MAKIGFTYYDAPTPVTPPTTQEMLASLSGGQSGLLLNSFAKGVRPNILTHGSDINRNVIEYFYKLLKNVEVQAKKIMRQEILVSSAVIDPDTGEETSPAVYNNKPNTAVQLRNALLPSFDLTSGQMNAVVNKIVSSSRRNDNGTWVFFNAEVVK